MLNGMIKYKKYQHSPVLIWQMGKVGSSTLAASIPNAMHIHTLYSNSPCHVHLAQRRNGFTQKLKGWAEDFLIRFYIKKRPTIKIITLVRSPFERNVSMLFEDLEYWMYLFAGKGNHDSTIRQNEDYLERVFYEAFDHEYGLTWFDKEIFRFTGIDVYAHPFDKNKGYSRIAMGRFDILILSSDKIDENEELISDFCGQEIKLTRANDGGRKWYAPVYKNFKTDVKFRDSYKDNIMQSKFYRHFF
jgi:hypothetical protein